ncbi:MAG TPA: dihydrofolate reductase family protein [Candidatus Acidoferrum sp.]|nr:dihydrofolate reductase family protein [Candidatus Acidoferrum sp.]
MRTLSVFNHVSLDGYFTDSSGGLAWAFGDKQDAEFNAFTEGNAKGGGQLLFGRATYDLMTRYWPTPLALQQQPVVAERMNNLPKVVFSRSLDKASWNNTLLVKGHLPSAVRKLKSESGPGLVIFGSGTIISQLAQEDLIDEFQFVVNPVVLGAGRTMFDGVTKKLNLGLVETRHFASGKLFLRYQLAA